MATAQKAVETLTEPTGPSHGVPVGSEAPPRKNRVTCRDHCNSCGRHFASLEAFDLHRPGTVDRQCAPPESIAGATPRTRLVEKATDGVCAIASDVEVHGVTVWQTEAARLQGRRPA